VKNHRAVALTLASLLAITGASSPTAAPRSFEIDPAHSSLQIDVGRAGFLKGFGHDHLIAAKELSGRVLLDGESLERSSMTLRVAAASLQVADVEISDKDRAEVQSTMVGSKVLDAARFPEIEFTSTQVRQAKTGPSGWEILLAGKLHLHGAEREVSFPVGLKLAGADLEARGEVSLLQTDYGITPVKAGGGLVKVNDSVRIRFVIQARERTP